MKKTKPRFEISAVKKESGLSLVLVLFAVLTLSFLIVVFFSLATNDRASTSAFTNSMKAEELGAGGLELVIGELRKEIADETRSTTNRDPQEKGPVIYVPTDRKYMVPEKIAADPLGNLLKVSKNNTTLFTGAGATLKGSAASSSTPSRNGRSISALRWNKSALGQFDGTTVKTPDWIYLDRKGPVMSLSLADASDPTKAGFVLGRIAFAIYDISGLLDMNVAGYPASLPAVDVVKKGSPGLVKLQGVGLSDTEAAQVVSFRNAHNASTPALYKQYLEKGDHKGFTKTEAGDNRFLSRQELIRFAKRSGFDDKLNFLSVFSREKNAPTYQPPTAVESSTNPSFVTLRHAITGRLLFEKRFPLSRLKLISDLAQNPGDIALAQDVAKYFGLTYIQGSRSFTYKASTIKTAAQIAAESEYRELDFFEILKAAIEAGSIGQSAGTTAMVADNSDKDTHIMQIGANIIDQYDLDPDTNAAGRIPIPTTIAWNGGTLYGVENLPYVNKISFLGENVPVKAGVEADNMTIGRENFKNDKVTGNNTPGEIDKYGFRVSAELWNPNFQHLPTASDYNPEIKLAISGATSVTMYDSYNAETPAETLTGAGGTSNLDTTRTISAGQQFPAQTWCNFNYFSEPSHVRFDRQPLPDFNYNKKTAGHPAPYWWCPNSARFDIVRPISVELAVIDKDGVPRTYQKTLETNVSFLKMSEVNNASMYAAPRIAGSTSFAHGDPRTNRLGYFGLNFRPTKTIPTPATATTNPTGSLIQFYESTFAPNNTAPYSIRPRFDKFGRQGTPYGVATTDGTPSNGYSPAGSSSYFLGLLWENTIAATRAQDPDGEYRQGDGGFAPGDNIPNPMEPIHAQYSTHTAWPPSGSRPAGTNSSRPVVLDRPFSSVADLGYVYRDVPWRSLNFSSTDSADASLLDVFSIDDTETIEGRVNPNSASADVLKALLIDSVKEEKTPTSVLTEGEALAAANRIRNYLSTVGPVKNISDFVTEFSTPTNLTDAELGKGAGGESSFAIKTQRESLIRALTGTTQTRTWNFLIDLVAQTGRFPKSPKSIDDFMVEGERRYWLHVAIDRYTGEVVSELLETVSE